MKTSELTGAHLSYWVAMAERAAEGTNFRATLPPAEPEIDLVGADGGSVEFAPWRDWAQGGPIIERARIEISPVGEGASSWHAVVDPYSYKHPPGVQPEAGGPSPLIAAMRAYVESKFGPEVGDESAEVFADKKRNG